MDDDRARRARRRRPSGREGRAESGSALMLVPAAVLILLALAALVLDTGATLLGQHELQAAAETAATDAVSALDSSAFYGSGRIAIDPTAARAVVDATVAAQGLRGVQLSGAPVVTVSGRQVCVALTATVRRTFGGPFGGVAVVHARSTATAAGDTGTSVPHRSIC